MKGMKKGVSLTFGDRITLALRWLGDIIGIKVDAI